MTDEGGPDEPLARKPGRAEPARPAARPQPADGVTRGLHVDMAPRHVILTPGDAQTATITVRNIGAIVDEVALAVSGVAAPWTRIAPASLNIYPGTEAQTSVRFAPPRGPTPAAGLLQLDIAVASTSQPEASTTYSTSIEITPYDNLSVTADGPTMLSGANEAVLPMRVRNLGNRPTNVRLVATPMFGVAIDLSVGTMLMEAGAEANVFATVRPPVQPAGAPARTYPFTVTVESDYSAPVTIDGRMEQAAVALPPKPPSRRPILVGLGVAGLIAALTVVAAFAGWIPGINLGGGTATDQPTATSGAVATSPTDQPIGPTTEPPIAESTPPVAESTPPVEQTTPPPAPELSFAERAAGDWRSATVTSPRLDEAGFPSSGFAGSLNITLEEAELPSVIWWWPAEAASEVLTCYGQLNGDVLNTNDSAPTLARLSDLTGSSLDDFQAELLIGSLCGTRADVAPDFEIVSDQSFVNTYLAHGDWRVILGGDDLTQPATTLDMIIDATVGDMPVITTINWVR